VCIFLRTHVIDSAAAAERIRVQALTDRTLKKLKKLDAGYLRCKHVELLSAADESHSAAAARKYLCCRLRLTRR
jgi:hypothetical protein